MEQSSQETDMESRRSASEGLHNSLGTLSTSDIFLQKSEALT